MRVLVVGTGGREHALAWSIQRSPLVDEVYCTAGNPGMELLAKPVDIDPLNIDALATWAREHQIDLTVVGPEAPLTHGIVDRFMQEGLRIVGPTRDAAQLEGSKVFAKELMQRHHIPTAAFHVCESPSDALQRIEQLGAPVVIKADGLAAGKGVLVCFTVEEARTAIHQIMVERRFGNSGDRVVIEEFLEGEEASILAFVDGKRAVPMVPAQDHKAIYDGDKGPNTGGMGAYSPAPVVTDEVMEQAHSAILQPIVNALAKEGRPYRGILYAGLMITKDGPKVIEFNCRFGDPETQAILPRLKSDLVPPLLQTAEGELSGTELEWDPRPCVSVVLASGGYPGSYRTGYPITGLESAMDDASVLVFHSGTRRSGHEVVTAGGRVVSVSAMGNTLHEAVHRAYQGVDRIRFQDMVFRRDIAHRALSRHQHAG